MAASNLHMTRLGDSDYGPLVCHAHCHKSSMSHQVIEWGDLIGTTLVQNKDHVNS